MKIIIVGAGKVGYNIAKFLSVGNDDVIIIDKKTEALEKIANNLDVMCIEGNCTSLKVLYEAGISECDLLISVTNSDELNMLCSLSGKKLGAKYTVARVRNPGYDEEITLLTEAVGIDLVINPEKAAAGEIAKLIKYPSVSSIDNFANDRVNLVGFSLSENSGLINQEIGKIDFIKGNLLFCGIERNKSFMIPKGGDVFQKDDKVYVIGEHRDIETLFKKLGKYKKRVKNAMIIGGGKISYYLAKKIGEVGVHSKIIEFDLNKCQELTELLPNSIIINGDGMDQDLLLSENLNECDSFIALTGRDEDNLIASLFASNNDVNNIITKVTRDNYNDVASAIGINSIISPKTVTAGKILKYVRTLKNKKKCPIENVYKICNEKAEAIEFIVSDHTKYIHKKLKDITFIKNSLIATIVRDNKIIIPSGDDCLKPLDRVIVVTQNANLLSLSGIFSGGKK